MEEEDEGELCWSCVRRRRQHCKKRLKLSCKEKILVYRLLSPTEQKIYWFLKSASRDGKKKVLIRNRDFTASIGSDYRSFHYAFHNLASKELIETSTLSLKGKKKTSPRKLYKFIGVSRNAMELFDFSN
jgi:hypothetical protein